jgi:catecholate siderophore receptor
VIDAMLAYQVNEKVTIQLNGYNLADEEYIATLNNGGSRYIPGTPLSALLSVNFTF